MMKQNHAHGQGGPYAMFSGKRLGKRLSRDAAQNHASEMEGNESRRWTDGLV